MSRTSSSSTLGSPFHISPCDNLTHNLSDDELAFVAVGESKSKKLASQKAQLAATLQLDQFFQSEFIEGGQINLFRNYEELENQNKTTLKIREEIEELRKEWSEVSYKMTEKKRNHNGFTHKQEVLQDYKNIFIAVNMLKVSEAWIRNHWERSLAATDSSFYLKAKQSIQYKELMKMDIQQEPPCENF
ncbi:MAG: hypothetical protein WDZ80_03720 [Candidatus Paceibacterota bacterium]